ncbi:MAG: Gfo/Idh/MocA family oxidoreductase [Kiritimatiellaeota bacterium]|nr:Gfo/Idh/MocA family oxidoreductase [Kiritimatiellota bacterium]
MSKEIRAGIVGCGGIANSHVKGYLENEAVIAGVFDVNSESSSALAGETGAEVFESFESMLKSGKIDVISVCTPPVAHEGVAVAALTSGISVLLEKPMANDIESGRAIVAAAAESDAVLMPAFRHRFLPALQRMKTLVDEGFIGAPVLFQNVFCGPAFGMKDKWFTKKAIAGGGCVLDTSSHSVDLFRFLFGEVVEQKSVTHAHFEGTDVEDAGIITVKAENGAVGTMSSTFVAGDGIAFVDAMGQDGRVVYDYLNPTELRLRKRGEEWKTESVETGNGGFAAEIKLFLDAVAKGTEPAVTANDAVRCLEVIINAY